MATKVKRQVVLMSKEGVLLLADTSRRFVGYDPKNFGGTFRGSVSR